MSYRDERGALRERVRALGEEIARREGVVTELFWRALPEDLARAFGEARGACAARGEGLEELLAAQAACERCLGMLDRALALLPELEAAWEAHPQELPGLERQLPELALFVTEAHVDLARRHGERILELARRHDALATMEERGRLGREVRLRVEGAPVAMLVELYGPQVGRNSRTDADLVLQVATSVRRATAPLRIRAEGWMDGMLKAVHLRRDVETGDANFDGYFLVTADPGAAAVLLTDEVRRSLLEIAREDVPVLEVGGGVARVRWAFEPSATSVDAALRAVLGIRRAPPSLWLRSRG